VLLEGASLPLSTNYLDLDCVFVKFCVFLLPKDREEPLFGSRKDITRKLRRALGEPLLDEYRKCNIRSQ